MGTRGREIQDTGKQSLTLPPPNRRRTTFKGEGALEASRDMEAGQVASRAVPIPGPMAEQGSRAAMADQGIRAAMADQGTRAAMVDPGTRAAMPDPETQAAMPDQGTRGTPLAMALCSGLCELLDLSRLWSGLGELLDLSGLWSGLGELLDLSGLWSGLGDIYIYIYIYISAVNR